MFPAHEHVFDDKTKRELLGQKIELERRRKGLSQMEVLRRSGLIKEDPTAKKRVSGVTVGFMTYVERPPYRGVTMEQLRAIAKVLGTSAKRLTAPEPLTRAETNELVKLRAAEETKKGRKSTTRAVATPAGSKKVATIRMPAGRVKTRTRPRAKPAELVVSELTPADRKILGVVQRFDETQKLFLVPAI